VVIELGRPLGVMGPEEIHRVDETERSIDH
jgi:hypothetical protein